MHHKKTILFILLLLVPVVNADLYDTITGYASNIETAVDLLAVIAAIYATIVLITSFGGEAQRARAKHILLYAFLGVLVVHLAGDFVEYMSSSYEQTELVIPEGDPLTYTAASQGCEGDFISCGIYNFVHDVASESLGINPTTNTLECTPDNMGLYCFMSALSVVNALPVESLEPVWAWVVTILFTIYVLLFSITGVILIWKGGIMEDRRDLVKEYLFNGVVGLVLVSISFWLYIALLELANAIIIQITTAMGPVGIINAGGGFDLGGAGILASNLLMLVTSVLLAVPVVVSLLLRFVLIMFGVIIFPIGICLWFFPPTRGPGGTIIRLSVFPIVWGVLNGFLLLLMVTLPTLPDLSMTLRVAFTVFGFLTIQCLLLLSPLLAWFIVGSSGPRRVINTVVGKAKYLAPLLA